MTKTLRFLALGLACAALSLTACSSGTKSGDTNVETGHTKKGPAAPQDGTANGDSVTAGIAPDTARRNPTGKELYRAADKAKDRNHDGLAD